LARIRMSCLLALALLAGCTTVRETQPPRTATEELLISSAVDHALDRFRPPIPAGTRIWVDARTSDSFDERYLVSAVKDRLLRQGGLLVAEKSSADAIVEVRAGALSIDSKGMLVGVPELALPIPFVGATKTPELSVAKRVEHNGVAKIGVTVYDAHTGALLPYSPSAPVYGFSDTTDWAVFSLFGWNRSDQLPEGVEPGPARSGGSTK
jgi:uncharacterized protein DUF6655